VVKHCVVLISAQNTGWFSASVKPMTASVDTVQEWPRLALDIKANRRWVVGVVNGNTSSSLITADLASAVTYFECPRDRFVTLNSHRDERATLRQFEAVQELSKTKLTKVQSRPLVSEIRYFYCVVCY
jgi:hypothetical protein